MAENGDFGYAALRNGVGRADDEGVSNDFRAKSLQSLVDIVGLVVKNVMPGDVYGLSGAEIARIGAKGAALAQAGERHTRAVAEANAALAARDAALRATVAILQATAARIEAGTEAKDGDLARIGFAPRRGRPARPHAPVAVTNLVATPDAFGGVRLTWDKEGNPRTAAYLVECRGAEGGWQFLKSTPRKSLRTEGFAPGVTAWFRVTATTATRRALPCAPVAVYGTPAAAPRRLASGGAE